MPALENKSYVHEAPFHGRAVSSIAALLFAIISAAFLGEYQSRAAADLVAHTLTVQLETSRLLVLIEDMEGVQRGFLITGEENALQRYIPSKLEIPKTLKTLSDLTGDNPAQQARLQDLGAQIDTRVQQLDYNIELRRAGGLEPVVPRIRSGVGRATILRIRQTVAEISDEENALLEARKTSQDQIALVVRGVEAIGLIALALASFLAFRQARAAHTARQDALKAQQEVVEAAKTASRLKSEFLASMSHEIRTPLNGVIGNIELLARSDLTPEQEEVLFDAEKAAKSLLALIGNVLDFSKIEAGKLTIENVDMAPAMLLQEAVDILQSRARQNNLFVTMSIGADVPLVVKGDPTRLRQILLNLLGNAVKFTLQGGIFASVEARDWQQDRCVLHFQIHDSGKGFDQAVANTLFEPFAQDKKQPAENVEGTGLGLAISKNLIEAFGGTIGCDSAPGQGASFWFTLPVVVVTPAAVPSESQLEGRAVMFVNGSGIQPPHLADYFRSHGARIVEANTREAALALAHGANGQHLLDLAIYVDHSGDPQRWPPISLAAELRAHHTVFAIYTPSPSPALQRHALSAGAAALLSQNTTATFLDRNIEHILGIASHVGDRAAPENPSIHDTTLLAGRRVLVLEDRLVNQTVIQRQLKTLNMTCKIVADGLAGLEALETERFDAILCDCSMPRMNGYDFARALRQREQDKALKRTAVIAMTANAFREDMEKCFASGMDDFVSKPVTLARLSTVLAHWIAKAAG